MSFTSFFYNWWQNSTLTSFSTSCRKKCSTPHLFSQPPPTKYLDPHLHFDNSITAYSSTIWLYDIIIVCDPPTSPCDSHPCDPPNNKIRGRDPQSPGLAPFPIFWFPLPNIDDESTPMSLCIGSLVFKYPFTLYIDESALKVTYSAVG